MLLTQLTEALKIVFDFEKFQETKHFLAFPGAFTHIFSVSQQVMFAELGK